jgi:hypothetical protein
MSRTSHPHRDPHKRRATLRRDPASQTVAVTGPSARDGRTERAHHHD